MGNLKNFNFILYTRYMSIINIITYKIITILFLVGFSTLNTYSQSGSPIDEINRIKNILASFVNVIDLLTIIAVAFAFLFFFWGLAIFILKAGEGVGEIEKGKNKMIWGVIAIFVLTTLWGLVYFIRVIFLGENKGDNTIRIFRLT